MSQNRFFRIFYIQVASDPVETNSTLKWQLFTSYQTLYSALEWKLRSHWSWFPYHKALKRQQSHSKTAIALQETIKSFVVCYLSGTTLIWLYSWKRQCLRPRNQSWRHTSGLSNHKPKTKSMKLIKICKETLLSVVRLVRRVKVTFCGENHKLCWNKRTTCWPRHWNWMTFEMFSCN